MVSPTSKLYKVASILQQTPRSYKEGISKNWGHVLVGGLKSAVASARCPEEEKRLKNGLLPKHWILGSNWHCIPLLSRPSGECLYNDSSFKRSTNIEQVRKLKENATLQLYAKM